MLVRKNLRPHKVIASIWRELALGLVSSAVFLGLFYHGHYKWLTLNFAPFAILGTALSIFLAFRTNSAYARWTQAAQAWMSMKNTSRVFVRLIKTIADGHSNLPAYSKKRSDAYIEEVAHRQIAWLHATQLTLRDRVDWGELKPYLPSKEFTELKSIQNKPVFLMARQGEQIYKGLQSGILQGFDSFQTETQLSALANAYTTAEQIKAIPMPLPYSFFTHAFVRIFIAIAPVFLLSVFAASDVAWMVVPMTLLIAFLFAPIDRLESLIEQPFGNNMNDVPITAITRDAERDILELIGEKKLPARSEPIDGALY